MLKNILFDLDGTLLPINQTIFIKTYFAALARRVIPLGYDKDAFFSAVWAGINAMMNNDGSSLNHDIFWEKFSHVLGDGSASLEEQMDDFYANEFDSVKDIQFARRSNKQLIRSLSEKGYRVVLATSPIFPLTAIRARLSWIDLSDSDFEYITTYENSSYGKLNLKYYTEILQKMGMNADESIMIGNNPVEDMCFEKLGGQVYLVTDDIENPDNVPTDIYKNGSFEELTRFLGQLPPIV